jgi:hypothetical protein
MNSRKKGTGTDNEVNITLTSYDLVSNCYTAGPYVHILRWYRVAFYLTLTFTIVY